MPRVGMMGSYLAVQRRMEDSPAPVWLHRWGVCDVAWPGTDLGVLGIGGMAQIQLTMGVLGI